MMTTHTEVAIVALGVRGPLSVGGNRAGAAVRASSAGEALLLLSEHPHALIVAGPDATDGECNALLELAGRTPGGRIIVAREGTDWRAARALAGDSLTYVARGALTIEDLSALVRSVMSSAAAVESDLSDPEKMADILGVAGALSAQPDWGSASRLLAHEAGLLVDADWCECLVMDGDDILSPERDTADDRDALRPIAGVVGYVTRTGRRVVTDDATADARFDQEIDLGPGLLRRRLLCQPVPGLNGDTCAVLVAARDGKPFDTAELSILGFLVACAGPILGGLIAKQRTEASPQSTDIPGSLFRNEALEFHGAGRGSEAGPLVAAPRWIPFSNWIAVGALVALVVTMTTVRIANIVSGPAVVRSLGRTEVTSPASGVVRSVDSRVGASVKGGEVLARLYPLPGASAADRVNADLRAPHDGVLSELMVRAGQRVEASELVATVTDESAGYEIVALLPGTYAPQYARGIAIALEIQGYGRLPEKVSATEVGHEVISRPEGLRILNIDPATAGALSPTLVAIRARLAGMTFNHDDRTFRYRDGIVGTATARIGSQSLVLTLVPALKRFRGF
jgi:hypothetical protein